MVGHRKSFFLIAVVFLSLFILVSCQAPPAGEFGIYLADSGELVLSEQHIKAFHNADNTFELNDTGIEKWNSYHVYPDIPKLKDTLFSREFVMKINGKEICRGKFYSMVSSASYSGVVILDALFKLDSEHRTISIAPGYASPGSNTLDSTISTSLTDFFERQGLLE
jgi:hypothetical protein